MTYCFCQPWDGILIVGTVILFGIAAVIYLIIKFNIAKIKELYEYYQEYPTTEAYEADMKIEKELGKLRKEQRKAKRAQIELEEESISTPGSSILEEQFSSDSD